MEKTLLIIKPDAIQRRFVGEIIRRFENKGFHIIAMKMTRLPEEIIRGTRNPATAGRIRSAG